MLKRITFLATLLLLVISGGTFYSILKPTAKERRVEEILTQEKALPQEGKYPTKQMRSGVTKDLWIHDPQMGRLHHHIESPRSILTAYTEDKHMHLLEQMIGMKCYLQEKIEKGEEGGIIQQIRYIESEEGTYRYSDHHFEAHSVFLALFRTPGDTLPSKFNLEEAFLQGVAKEVSLSFSEDTPQFHAQKFKAHIRPQRNAL